MVQWIEAPEQRAAIARQVLESLPDWFGIPESREAYIRGSRTQPFWADIEPGAVRGFLTLKETSPHTSELAVMGVLPQHHRQGVGRALFEAFRQFLKGYRATPFGGARHPLERREAEFAVYACCAGWPE